MKTNRDRVEVKDWVLGWKRSYWPEGKSTASPDDNRMLWDRLAAAGCKQRKVRDRKAKIWKLVMED